MLKLSQDKRFLMNHWGKPFFWLGDTAWELIHRCSKEEIILYLDDRKSKGFNLIQTVILAEQDGINTPNVYGDKPLIDNDPERINGAYFEIIDFVLDQAEERDMEVALLPTWGDKVVLLQWGKGPLIFTPEKAGKYGRILGEKYKDRKNLLWIIGGDRIPETEEHREIFESMARGIRSVDNSHLMSYHPLGTHIASDHFDSSWLDIDMCQSGHDRDSREYEYVDKNRRAATVRPLINGEARYENIGNAFWYTKNDEWLDDYDVRVSAWWTMLAGAAGYTYGCNDIWQMYKTGRSPVIQARTDWTEALHLPGARQMGHMKNFFTQFPWQQLKRDQSCILNHNPEDASYQIASILKDGSLLIAYTPMGKALKIDLTRLKGDSIYCWWFNPRSGTYLFIGERDKENIEEFTPWAKGRGSDFVLVLSNKQLGF